MKNAVELIAALRYKLCMLRSPINGTTNTFYNNKAVHKNASTPESQLRKKHHSILYHMRWEAVADGAGSIPKEETLINISDLFTKVFPNPRKEMLLNNFNY